MAKKPISSKTKKPEMASVSNVVNPLLKESGAPWHWDDFDDWNINNNNFPHINSRECVELGDVERKIVSENVELLGNSENWNRKLLGFKALLENKIRDEAKREEKRAEYAIRFDGVDFSNRLVSEVLLNFDDMTFPCSVSFNDVKFEVTPCFRRVKFIGDVNFYRTKFNRDSVSFDSCLFKETVSFYEAIINSNFNFFGATFENQVQFYDVNMNGAIDFTRSMFQKNLYFVNRSKINKMQAKDMEVRGNLVVVSKFRSAVLQGLSVEGITNFSGSRFETVPDFRDSKLDRPPEVAGMIVPPPIMNPFRWFKFTKSKDEEDVAKYRKLKAMALAANDHEKDGEFFGYEMMAKRGHETKGFWPLLLNSLYWRWSNYGQSIWRPFKAMLRSWGMFSVINMIIVLCSVKGLWSDLTLNFVFPIEEILFSISHSFYNVVPLIGGLFRTAAIPDGHDSWYDKTYHELIHAGFNADYLTAFSTLQQFIGAVLFFLLFLGLRNKFRLK